MNVFILAVLILMYVGIIVIQDKKAWISLGAALVLIIGGATSASHAITSLINWNILLIYLGSLALAELFIYSRAPAFLAERIVEHSPSAGVAVTIILLLTGLVSAFVENVATVLLVAPVMIELGRKTKKNLAPLMIGLAVMANLQGTATLIGDPPSMIFADFAQFSFNDFFFREGRPSIFFAIQIASIVGVLYFFLFFRSMKSDERSLPVERIVSWVPAGLFVLMIAGLAGLSALSADGGIHFASGIFVVGLAGIGLGWLTWVRKEGAEAKNMIRHLDWETLVFLVGIFIAVGTVSESGLLDGLGLALARWTGGNKALGFVLIIGISVLVSGFVDNVPYIAAMLPVAAKFASTMGGKPELFMFGLLIGTCIGGNLTPFGASANIVAVSLSEKNGAKVNFWLWLKIAGPFTILTTSVAGLFVWLVWS